MATENRISMLSIPMLKKFVRLCFRSWKLFLLCILGTSLLTCAYLYKRIPTKEVEAQLMLRDESAGASMLAELAGSLPLGMFGGSSTTDNESMILSSHSVYLKTVKDLGMNISYEERLGPLKYIATPLTSALRLTPADEAYNDTISIGIMFKVVRTGKNKFDITANAKPLFKIKKQGVSLPYDFKTPYGTFTIQATPFMQKTEAEKFRITYMSYAAAAENLAKKVRVYVPDRKTDFIALSYATPSAKFGVELLNTMIANYVDIANQYRDMRNEQSLSLIDERLANLQLDLKKSEGEIEKFKQANKLTDPELDATYLMTKTGSLESSLLEAQTKFEVASMTRDFINNPKNKNELIPDLFATAGMSASSDGASSNIGKYNEMLLQRMQLLESAKSNSAVVKQLDDQLSALHTTIVASVNRVYENASVALRDLKEENAETKSRISDLPSIERGYLVLKRDNLLQEKMYLFLLQQKEELRMQLDNRSMPAQIIDPPHALVSEKPTSSVVILLFGILLGCCIAGAIVFLKKMKEAPYATSDEFKADLEAPVLEMFSADKSATETGINIEDGHVNAEKFRQLRSEVQMALKDCNGNVVTVTSLKSGEGKTYVAVNLAAALAKLGKKVVLIDAAMRNPKVSKRLDISAPKAALAQYMRARVDMQSIITEAVIDDNDSLSVITAAESTINPSDILGSERFAQLVGELRADYDYVVIDASRIRGYSDVTYLTDLSDITVVVCRAGISTPDAAAEINKSYEEGNLKRIAVVGNAFK